MTKDEVKRPEKVSTELGRLDALAQAELVRRGEVTPVELVQAAIERIGAVNHVVNAVVTEVYESALTEAETIGRSDGGTCVFGGVPFLIKDLFARAAGMPLSEGSLALRNYISPDDSELVRRFKRAGLILLGKTNTPEFGATPVCEGRLFGPARNPWSLDRTPGGSSGGAAAAVATRMVPIAHGNDGGGSLRIPASCCGVFALKPSRGRNPLGPEYGDFHRRVLAEHVISISVRDSAAVLDATHGALAGSVYSAPPPERPFVEEVQRDPRPLRIAFSVQPLMPVPVSTECIEAVQHTASLCEQLGHQVVESSPTLQEEQLMAAWFDLWAEGNAWLVSETEERTGQRPRESLFEPLTWHYFESARRRTVIEHLHAIRELERASQSIALFLETFDVWLTPTLAQPPLPIGGFFQLKDNRERYLRFSPFTRLANIAGIPAMSVPLFWNHEGLPIGSHFAGRLGDEATLFRLAGQLEGAQPWEERVPPDVVDRHDSTVPHPAKIDPKSSGND